MSGLKSSSLCRLVYRVWASRLSVAIGCRDRVLHPSGLEKGVQDVEQVGGRAVGCALHSPSRHCPALPRIRARNAAQLLVPPPS